MLWNAFHTKIGEKVKRWRGGKLKEGTYGKKPINEVIGVALIELELKSMKRKSGSTSAEIEQLQTDVTKLEKKEKVEDEVLRQKIEDGINRKFSEHQRQQGSSKKENKELSSGSQSDEGSGSKLEVNLSSS